MKRRNRHAYLAPADDGGAGGSGAPPATAPAAAPPAAAAPAPATPSGQDPATLLQQGTGGAQGTDWLPEKFRVAKEDGTVDTEASARKLAASYTELEKTRPTGNVPKTAEEYAPKDLPEGIDFEAVKKDPIFTGFLKGAHARHMTNEDVSYVLGEYFKIAPELIGADKRLSAEEATAELGKVWTDTAAMQANLTQAQRAVKGFGADGDVPGGYERLMAKYGNDPDFLAFAASVGKEMQEDTPIADGTPAASDWDAEVAKIKADPAYQDERHPQHKGLVERMSQLYQRRYGQKLQQLGAAATR
jgi:hypothetical protein